MLQGLQVLGGAGASIEPGLVPGRPIPDELDVGLGLGDLALHVTQGGLRAEVLVGQQPGLTFEVGEFGVRRQVRPGMGDLAEPGIDGLDVEQASLARGVGFHVAHPIACPGPEHTHQLAGDA